MAAPSFAPQNSAERLISATLGGTWALWLIGGLYFAGPALGWALAMLVWWQWYSAPARLGVAPPRPLPLAIILWLGGMSAMLVILIIGHVLWGLGAGQTLKSAVGWAKGWALLGLFPLAGFALPIRLTTLARSVCRLGRQTLVLLPLFVAAPFLHLPQILFVSPLRALGGPSDEFFAVVLFTVEPGVGTPRWQFFAPWSPAAGMVAMVHILIARTEPQRGWRYIGYAAGVAIAILSQSRMALVSLAVIIPLAALPRSLGRPKAGFTLAGLALAAGWLWPVLKDWSDAAVAGFNGSRAASSRVRATLGRIAVQRWHEEAYWFGHGIVERGPHLVEYMPIGSHHSWYGLLYVKGLTGLIALAVPLVGSLAAAIHAAMRRPEGQLALSVVLVLWLYSFGENLEVLIYLAWPALVAFGISLRQVAEAIAPTAPPAPDGTPPSPPGRSMP